MANQHKNYQGKLTWQNITENKHAKLLWQIIMSWKIINMANQHKITRKINMAKYHKK